MFQGILTALAVLLRITSNPLGNVFQKQLIHQGNHPLMINFLTYFFLSIPCIGFAFGVNWNKLPMDFWLSSLAGGILGAFGNGFLVKAMEKGDLSVLGPINSYKSLVGIVVGIFLLGELPNAFALAGIALIIYGSYFILDTTEDKFSWKLLKRPEMQFRIWAMILTAVEAVFGKRIILSSSILTACISWCWFGTLFSLLFLVVNKIRPDKEIGQFRAGNIWKMLGLVLCSGTMLITTTYTFQHMPVGYALSLFQLSMIGSILLGHRIFKEQHVLKKLMGSVIMIVGSVVIILFKDF